MIFALLFLFWNNSTSSVWCALAAFPRSHHLFNRLPWPEFDSFDSISVLELLMAWCLYPISFGLLNHLLLLCNKIFSAYCSSFCPLSISCIGWISGSSWFKFRFVSLCQIESALHVCYKISCLAEWSYSLLFEISLGKYCAPLMNRPYLVTKFMISQSLRFFHFFIMDSYFSINTLWRLLCDQRILEISTRMETMVGVPLNFIENVDFFLIFHCAFFHQK